MKMHIQDDFITAVEDLVYAEGTDAIAGFFFCCCDSGGKIAILSATEGGDAAERGLAIMAMEASREMAKRMLIGAGKGPVH